MLKWEATSEAENEEKGRVKVRGKPPETTVKTEGNFLNYILRIYRIVANPARMCNPLDLAVPHANRSNSQFLELQLFFEFPPRVPLTRH